jgi:hypothetical protein
MCEYGHITNKEIYSSYKDLLDPMRFEEIMKFLEGPFLTRARIFKDLSSAENNLEPKIHNVIHLLKSTKTIQWYSIALSALQPVYEGVKLTKELNHKLIELFESIHEIMFTLNFSDKVANELEKKIPLIAKGIKFSGDLDDFGKQLNDAIIHIESLKIEQGLHFSKIDFSNPLDWVNSFEKNNSLGHMLIFLFKYKNLGSSTNKIFVSSLEHTLPQTPSIENWPSIDGVPADNIKRHIYSIGNFFVTHSSDNSSYGNKKFNDKKELYKTHNLFDVIDEGNKLNFKSVEDWNFDLIKQREDYIIQKFCLLSK